jgi:hypothetical protein
LAGSGRTAAWWRWRSRADDLGSCRASAEQGRVGEVNVFPERVRVVRRQRATLRICCPMMIPRLRFRCTPFPVPAYPVTKPIGRCCRDAVARGEWWIHAPGDSRERRHIRYAAARVVPRAGLEETPFVTFIVWEVAVIRPPPAIRGVLGRRAAGPVDPARLLASGDPRLSEPRLRHARDLFACACWRCASSLLWSIRIQTDMSGQ